MSTLLVTRNEDKSVTTSFEEGEFLGEGDLTVDVSYSSLNYKDAMAIAVATVGKPFIDIPGVVDASAHARRSLDLQMFNGFNNPHPWWGPWTNTFGNIALFMPLGVCLVVLGQNSRRVRFGRGGTILLAMALSLGIEITQYVFSLGFSDVDDLVFNTLGASLGAFLLSRSSFKAQLRAVRFIGWTAAAGLGALAAVILAVVIV